MDAQTFLDNFATIADAPGGTQRLRELVLELAVHGELVEQDPADESAAVLLAGLRERRDALVTNGVIGKPRHPEGIPVDDAPHAIPASWCWARLGDIGAIVGGGTPKSDEPAYWADGVGVPWLTPADMGSQSSRLVSRGSRDITEKGLDESSAQLLPAGTVLFSSRAPIGHVGIAAQPLSTNQGFKSCLPYQGAMTEYIYLFLRYVGPIVDAAATGTTFKEVSGKDVALIPIPVPPLGEQQRIVPKVDELMGLCDELEARQERRDRATTSFGGSALHALTEADTPGDIRDAWERVDANWSTITDQTDDVVELEATILHLAVLGRLTRGDEDFEDKSAPSRVAGWSSLPRGWQWKSLQEVVDPDRSISYGVIKLGPDPGPSGVPVLRCSDVRRMRIDKRGVRHVDRALSDEYRRTILRGGELLVNVRGTLGGCAVVPREMAGFNVAREVAVVPTVDIDPAYLLYVFASPGFLNYTADSLRGTAYQGLNLSLLRAFPVPVPPKDEQAEIVARVNGMLTSCANLVAAGRAATQTATALSRALVAHAV